MNPEQRLQLHEMIRANNTQDNTSLIRQLRHSSRIRADVERIVELRQTNPLADLTQEASFLYTNYTMIFNRLLKDRLDVSVLYSFLDVLKEIEEGCLDQHEASFKIGTLLKEMYVDPKLEPQAPVFLSGKTLSWQEFKQIK